ncbi:MULTISPECIES: ferredoxin [Streptomyces]|jgi:ferredoxin|uniref:Ferredoxin n=1 Tax=Streptomyces thermoviolaceus subsp. thermoviolaceus TaxID=66860 RepID=A0ABX0YUJ4_STRTL|nr:MULTISPECIES: ferredoxin [Streptomyces]MCM3266810.1 ferredoxin [Streptomyces thermoviolaceus]NJP16302.1 ferredoxin [Streptomyces thermoviolaceus subsp. thermoviolaceus]RSS08150.1 ferredoxin [Streptomyces sp. WAC00469]WTD50568.1 ferredoxin [Streptomyces thermoviolaceus]GGV82429.1 ferredoxin [Streptomyces thermoviolaceus subsp. apingens]
MQITIDEAKCCGAGQCVLVAPEVFDQRDEDGIVVLLDASPDAAQHAAVREAATICPAAAIQVRE